MENGVESYKKHPLCYTGETGGYGYAFVPGGKFGVVLLDIRSKNLLDDLSMFQADVDETRIELLRKNGLLVPLSTFSNFGRPLEAVATFLYIIQNKIRFNMVTNKDNNKIIPTVDICFDEEWEARNWHETIFNKPRFGLRSGKDKWNLGGIPVDLPKILEKIESKEERMLLVKKRLSSEIKRPEVIQLINSVIVSARKRWEEVNKEFFFILSTMIDVPLAQFEFHYRACFTLSSRAPFVKNAFMFNKYLDFGDLAMHEIMHIEFLKVYTSFCIKQGLNEAQVDHLKEVLTVLLNEDARNLLTRLDPGYMKHQEVRAKTLATYINNGGSRGNFKNFLKEIIPMIKQHDFN